MSTSATISPTPRIRLFSAPEARAPPAWRQSTWAIACAGSLLLWAALPPLAWGWLGWFAPIPWLLLVRRDELAGRRPYLKIYLAGVLFWLMTLHWLRLPHPATYFGWLALAAYLGAYLPMFVGLSRVGVHHLRWPLWIVAPVVWTGLELAQGHLMTGFLMGSLGHTQVHFNPLIQAADLVGAYGVSFLVMLVAALITGCLSIDVLTSPRLLWKRVLVIVCIVLAAVMYGVGSDARDAAARSELTRKDPTIALIQGNTLPTWKQEEGRQKRIMDDYLRLSKQAVAEAKTAGRSLDVIIWPETMFRTWLATFSPNYKLPPGTNYSLEENSAAGPNDLKTLATMLGTPLLVGIDRLHWHHSGDGQGPMLDAYNSTALVNRAGKLLATYDKSHLVVFGEYVPFAKWLPWLDTLTPITGSATHGAGPVAFDLDGIRYVPSICYETVIPHVIRRQVRELSQDGKQPDVLVNVTNDAWYWGSSELDQHLACGVFRAIETRTPLVIAANGGLSAVIDGSGKILHQSTRLAEDVIVAMVPLDPRTSFYVATGDWFAGSCLAACVALAFVGWRTRRGGTP
ncbi:MAG: apolipoprotein N-acyltransferase [Pirellulales bacterium]